MRVCAKTVIELVRPRRLLVPEDGMRLDRFLKCGDAIRLNEVISSLFECGASLTGAPAGVSLFVLLDAKPCACHKDLKSIAQAAKCLPIPAVESNEHQGVELIRGQ